MLHNSRTRSAAGLFGLVLALACLGLIVSPADATNNRGAPVRAYAAAANLPPAALEPTGTAAYSIDDQRFFVNNGSGWVAPLLLNTAGGGVSLQATTPGTADTGNANVTGALIAQGAGSVLGSGTFDATGYTLQVAGTGIHVDRWSAVSAATGPNLSLFRARGTQAAPSAALSADALGVVQFRGFGATVQGQGPTIQGLAAENWTDAAHGSSVQISTVPTGGVALAAAVNVNGDGTLELVQSTAKNRGTCTLNGATPSACTVSGLTTNANARCLCGTTGTGLVSEACSIDAAYTGSGSLVVHGANASTRAVLVLCL